MNENVTKMVVPFGWCFAQVVLGVSSNISIGTP